MFRQHVARYRRPVLEDQVDVRDELRLLDAQVVVGVRDAQAGPRQLRALAEGHLLGQLEVGLRGDGRRDGADLHRRVRGASQEMVELLLAGREVALRRRHRVLRLGQRGLRLEEIGPQRRALGELIRHHAHQVARRGDVLLERLRRAL